MAGSKMKRLYEYGATTSGKRLTREEMFESAQEARRALDMLLLSMNCWTGDIAWIRCVATGERFEWKLNDKREFKESQDTFLKPHPHDEARPK